MAFYDDKRFILSHIRHSFITSDDSTMCENVMLFEPPERYSLEAMYHKPIYLSSNEELTSLDDSDNNDQHDVSDHENGDDKQSQNDSPDDLMTECKPSASNHLIAKTNAFSVQELALLKATEIDLKSELVEENSLPNPEQFGEQSYDISIRRRSNTAQRLEKLKQEKKVQAKTKNVAWNAHAKIVDSIVDGKTTKLKRVVFNPNGFTSEEIVLLDYDPVENVYYETEAYRRYLFPDMDQPGENINDQEKINQEKNRERKKSALTYLIEKSPAVPVNPFNQFTRFDARVTEENLPKKRIQIFIRVHGKNPEFRDVDFTKKIPPTFGIACGRKWIEVNCLSNTRICDLVGLVCWHYTQLQLGPPLEPDSNLYALKICEENGDIDSDFPSLTPFDEIKRYGFPYLAMVEIETPVVVTVFIEPEEVFSQISVTSSTTLKDVVDQIVKKRAHLFKNKKLFPSTKDYSEYLSLELIHKPNLPLNLDSTVSEYYEGPHKALSFTLKLLSANNKSDNISTNTSEASSSSLKIPSTISSASRGKITEGPGAGTLRHNYSFAVLSSIANEAPAVAPTYTPSLKKRLIDLKDWSHNVFNQMEAPMYKTFDLLLLNKFYSSPVELGISGAYIEITSKQGGNKSPSTHFADRLLSKFQQIKPQTIQVENVVDAFLLPKHSSNRKSFKLIYHNGHDFKKFKFEGEIVLVDEILFKLKNCMQMSTSPRRLEYQVLKERKKSLASKLHFKSRLSVSSSSSSDDNNTDSINSSQSEAGDTSEASKGAKVVVDGAKKSNYKFGKFK